MTTDRISREILDSAYKVHSALGPGLLESAYRTCLAYELREKGLLVEEEKVLPVFYEKVKLDLGYRMDLLVDDKVIVELKTVEEFNEVHIAQLLTYLRFSRKHIGLLLNFYVKSLKDGIRRVVL